MNPRQKRALKQQIRSNKHEIYVVSFDEMDNIIKSSSKARQSPSIKEHWQRIRGGAEVGASYYSSADDAVTLSKLISDLGAAGARAYVKSYKGKPHIILKGRPGLRKVLTGTKYGIKNPKVVTMGLGRAGAINAAKQGGILSIVLLTGFRVVDHFLTDNSTLTKLVGHLATDIVKVGIATGASIGAATLAAGFSLAIGPIVVVIVVGVAASWTLQQIDNHYGITNRLVSGLDEVADGSKKRLAQIQKNINDSIRKGQDVLIDYVIEYATRTIVNIANHQLNRFRYSIPKI